MLWFEMRYGGVSYCNSKDQTDRLVDTPKKEEYESETGNKCVNPPHHSRFISAVPSHAQANQGCDAQYVVMVTYLVGFRMPATYFCLCLPSPPPCLVSDRKRQLCANPMKGAGSRSEREYQHLAR